MDAIALEHVTPRVISGGHKRIVLTPPAEPIITPYKGCFVRYKIKSGGSPVLDTIKLVDTVAWSYYEAIENDGNYNNRPFGIIDNRPAETDTVKDPNAGKWVVIVFDTEDAPVRVAFRVINDNFIIDPATANMVGKQFKIYGVEMETAEGTFIIPCVMGTASGGLICREVYPAIRKENDPDTYADYGWVVLDLNYATESASPQEGKFLSFPYVIPTVS